jgi:hypothetical protein
MRVRELLAALARQWNDIRVAFDQSQTDRLHELVAALVTEPDPGRLVRTAQQIVDLLTDVLPDGHPLLLILERPNHRLTNVRNDHAELAAWQPVVAALRLRLPGERPTPTVDEVAEGASAWLLAADSCTEDEVRGRGHDPDDPDLIRLQRPDGSSQWPAFQFAYPELVRSINRVLDAADDPWGAADWWLGENTWLSGAPATLIGHVADQELTQAALDERAEG